MPTDAISGTVGAQPHCSVREGWRLGMLQRLLWELELGCVCLRVAHTFTPKRYVFLSVLSLIIILRAGEQVKGKYLQGVSFPKAFSSLSNSGQWFASGFFFWLEGRGNVG